MQTKLGRQKEDKQEDKKSLSYIQVPIGEGGHEMIIVLIDIRERDQTSAMGSSLVATVCEAQDGTSRLHPSSPGSFEERKRLNLQLRYYLV